MSITSYNTFINNLGDLVVSGVNRRFDGPPASVTTADMPCSFPRAVSGDEGPLTVQDAGGWPTLRGSLVIIVEPVGQSTSPLNHAAVVDIADAISTTLRAVDAPTLGRAPINWTIELVSNEIVGETPHWALVTTVEGHG